MMAGSDRKLLLIRKRKQAKVLVEKEYIIVMAKYTNTLRSHHGESRTYRADKMSSDKNFREGFRGKSKSDIKQFSTRKRRPILHNPLFFDKIYNKMRM